MIDVRDIKGYIGGSDAQRVHGNWETPTFQKFWRERLTGIKESSFENIHTVAGNIMEGRVLSALGIPEEMWNAYFEPKETMAGINTDAYDRSEGIYHEVKNLLWTECWTWILGRNISAGYMYQLKHGLLVTGAKKGLLHVCMVTPEEKVNPFLIKNVGERVHTFEFGRDFFDYADFKGKSKPITMTQYGKLVEHLTECYKGGKQPREADRLGILNSFS